MKTGDGSLSCSISTEEHYLGSKSLKVVNGDAFSPLFTAEAGKTYTFSGDERQGTVLCLDGNLKDRGKDRGRFSVL